MERKRKSVALRIILWSVILAAFVGPGAYVYFREPVIEVTANEVTRGEVETTIAAITAGSVISKGDSMVASGVIGIVVEVRVEEGSRVQAGDPLIVMEHEELDAHVRLAKANLAAARSQLKQVELGAAIFADVAKTQVSLAREQLKAAQQNYDRISELSDRDVASQSDMDRFSLALRVAQENLETAQAGERENLVRKEEVLSAQSMVEQMDAALAVTNATRDKAFVRAPLDGVVAKLIVDVGEAVAPGMPLLHLVDDHNLYVEAPFDEANAEEISLGQIVRINLDAYRDEDFRGEISHVSPVVSLNPDLSRTLDLKVRLLEQAERFIPGMSADVTIIVEEKSGVLVVPAESIIRDEYVYVIEKGRAHRRIVTLGAGNWNTKEVVKGLSEGDVYITSVSLKDLSEGVRVRRVESLED